MKKTIKIIIILVVTIILFELILRMYLSNLGIKNISDLIINKYPELKIVFDYNFSKNKDEKNILFLGGSVLYRFGYNNAGKLKRVCKEKYNSDIKIFNLAYPGHTLLDSYYKYRFLEKYNFDVIVIYNNINDLLTNHYSDSEFKNDYLHFEFYNQVKNIYRNRKIFNYIRIPYFFNRIISAIYKPQYKKYADRKKIMSFDYGSNIKSAHTFENKLNEIILSLNSFENRFLILSTFAWYIPGNYTEKLFLNKKLDYAEYKKNDIIGEYRLPVEDWGQKTHIVKGLKLHNKIIFDTVRKYSNNKILFFDFYKQISGDGNYFFDVCHLSEKGQKIYMENLIEKFSIIFQ